MGMFLKNDRLEWLIWDILVPYFILPLGKIQFWLSRAAGLLLQSIRTCFLVLLRGIRQLRAGRNYLSSMFRPRPPSRCPICGVLSENCNAGYEYDALEKRESEIRLLRLLLGEKTLACETATFPLSRAPSYTALSYRWTEDEPSDEILINGKTFFIRDNLFNFLQASRQDRYPGWIFIDAICINQHDLAERSNQVALMRDIYEEAAKATVWRGMSFMSGVTSHGYAKSINLRGAKLQILDFVAKAMQDTFHGSDDREANVMWALACMNNYWTRLWPIQEILAAEQVEFKAEHATVEWERFLQVHQRHFGRNGKFPLEMDPQVPPHCHILQLEESLDENRGGGSVHHITTVLGLLMSKRQKTIDAGTRHERMPLHEAILTFAAQRCSDPRDKIFGLLGISHSHIRADYRMSLAELYLRALIEGFVGVMDETTTIDSKATSETIDGRLRAFVYTLQYALGLDPLNPAVMLLTSDALSGIIPDPWLWEDLSWIRSPGLQNFCAPFVQGEKLPFDLARLFWHFLYTSTLYQQVCRAAIEHREPFLALRKALAKYFPGTWVKLFFDLANVSAWLVRVVHLQILYEVDDVMAFPAGAGQDVRTYSQWHRLHLEVRRDLEERGVLPQKYTDAGKLIPKVVG